MSGFIQNKNPHRTANSVRAKANKDAEIMGTNERKVKSDLLVVKQCLRILHPGPSVFEIRSLVKPVRSGYFNDTQQAAKSLAGVGNGGLYVVLNEVDRNVLNRSANRFTNGPGCKAGDIIRRRWLLLDFDPKRISGIPSSDAEHDAALALGGQASDWLTQQGLPECLMADSGNGCHLLMPICLDTGRESTALVKGLLEALAGRFDTDAVKLDTTVHDLPRIVRLYGTVNAKGDDTEERPHRLSKLLNVPESLRAGWCEAEAADGQMLQRLVPERRSASVAVPRGAVKNEVGLLECLSLHGVEYRETEGTADYPVKAFVTCPFDDSHSGTDAYVAERDNGARVFHCSHNSCAGRKWTEFRRQVGMESRKNENRYAVDVDAKNAGKRSKRVDTADRFVPFPLKDLGPVLADFCQQVAASVGCDPAFPATYALAVCASAIGSSRSIFLKPDWQVPCILWTMCIGESGSGKSPPLRACMEPLNVRRSAYNAEFTQAMTEFRRECREHKKQMKDYDRGEIDAEPPEPKRPLHRRCSMSDTTIHAIAGVLADNPRGVLLCRDEQSGWLTGFDRFSKGRSGASSEAPLWLEMYNANSIEVDRKSECQYLAVESPHVSISGGIQPRIFQRAMSAEMQDNGLQARFLMCYPPRGMKQWRDESLSDKARRKYQEVIDALFELKQESLLGQNLCPAALSLSAEAKRLLQCWVDRHGEEQHSMTGLLASMWSKMEEAPGRLSIVLHCVQQVTNGVEDHFAVSADVMQQALSIAEWFKSEALRIHRLMQEPNGASEQRSLIQWIRGRGGRITANELRRNRRDLRDRPAEEAETVLQMLVNGGLGDWHSIKGSREFVAIDDALST